MKATMKSKSTTDRTPWFDRSVNPVNLGVYECAVSISRGVPLTIWKLEWDGVGFVVPFPMVVVEWRGLTRSSYLQLLKTKTKTKK